MRFLVTGAIGAVDGVATGYAVDAVSNSAYSGGVIVWSDTLFRAMDAILFAIIGAGVTMELSFFANRQLAHWSTNFDTANFMQSTSEDLDV